MQTPDPLGAQMAARLKYLRELARLTQRQFAMFMGVTYQMVQLWEKTGTYRAQDLPRMAQILDCTILAFFDTDIAGRPTRPTRAVDRLTLDAAQQLTAPQREALTQFLRAMTAPRPAEDVPEPLHPPWLVQRQD